jgi:hypothetical protein
MLVLSCEQVETMIGILIDSKNKTVQLMDKEWSLEEMQELIGGYLEAVAPPMADLNMFVNEDGIRLDLPKWKTPFMLHGKAGMIPYCGNAIILGAEDDEGELSGLEKEQADSMVAFLKAEIIWG